MDKCPTISRMSFSPSGTAAMEEIREIHEMRGVLSYLFAGVPLVSIFFGAKPLSASFNIASFDWHAWADAMSKVPQIGRNRVLQIAYRERLKTTISSSEKEFWGAVINGCEI